MSKVRLYEVKTVDGYGEKTNVYPAPSKGALSSALDDILSPHERPVSITHLGFRLPEARPTEDCDGVQFQFTLETGTLEVLPGTLGHKHVSERCIKDVQQVEEYNRRYHDDPPGPHED